MAIRPFALKHGLWEGAKGNELGNLDFSIGGKQAIRQLPNLNLRKRALRSFKKEYGMPGLFSFGQTCVNEI